MNENTMIRIVLFRIRSVVRILLFNLQDGVTWFNQQFDGHKIELKALFDAFHHLNTHEIHTHKG